MDKDTAIELLNRRRQGEQLVNADLEGMLFAIYETLLRDWKIRRWGNVRDGVDPRYFRVHWATDVTLQDVVTEFVYFELKSSPSWKADAGEVNFAYLVGNIISKLRDVYRKARREAELRGEDSDRSGNVLAPSEEDVGDQVDDIDDVVEDDDDIEVEDVFGEFLPVGSELSRDPEKFLNRCKQAAMQILASPVAPDWLSLVIELWLAPQYLDGQACAMEGDELAIFLGVSGSTVTRRLQTLGGKPPRGVSIPDWWKNRTILGHYVMQGCGIRSFDMNSLDVAYQVLCLCNRERLAALK